MKTETQNYSIGALLLTAMIAWIFGLFSMVFVYKVVNSGLPEHESIVQIQGSKHHWQQWAIVDKEFNTISPLGDTIKLTIHYPINHD